MKERPGSFQLDYIGHASADHHLDVTVTTTFVEMDHDDPLRMLAPIRSHPAPEADVSSELSAATSDLEYSGTIAKERPWRHSTNITSQTARKTIQSKSFEPSSQS